MFSPHEGGPATATRSRRRQRPISSDTLLQQPKAKRQRLPLTEQTITNPDVPTEMFQVKSDKAAMLSAKRNGIENAAQISQPAPKKELSVRSKKPKAGERISKGDGSVVLASNGAYTVSKLPALPEKLRADTAGHQHGSIYSANGYAVSLTHTHAIVWAYTTNGPTPETFTFTLPYPSRHASDPLPLGALVAPSASSEEPGLVVVMPTTGKVSYWESISSAATLDFLHQQRTSVEDVVPGISSTECVAEVINAEPAGFALLTSSGRIACLNVRDAHGRPAISVQFLRSATMGSFTGGFFGSIRHALKHSASLENVVAVRAGHVFKVGERTVMAANSKGKFSAWKVHRGGSYDTVLDIDAREPIINALQQFDTGVDSVVAESLELVDFTFVPRGIESKYADAVLLTNFAEYAENDEVHQLLLLVSLPRKSQTPYYLVELILSHEAAHVGMIRPVISLTSPINEQQQSIDQHPRVYLPRPAVVAYIVFDKTVVISSLAQPPDTPDSQLQGEDRQLPTTFEDVIDLRGDGTTEIVGSGIEEPVGTGLSELDGFGVTGARQYRHKTKNPAAVLLIRGVGVVRLATSDIDRFVSDHPPQITAKSKLEEAVFFGIKEDNPLVFDGKRQSIFSDEETGEAAMELSRDILGSKTSFTPKVPASLESNLRARASYLRRLMMHLNARQIQVSRRVRWRLLWDAEKMSVATNMWILHEQFLADRADGKTTERKTIVSEIVEYIHEDEKKNPNRDVGEVDRVRHFFVNDVWRMDLFIAWAYEVIKYVYKNHLLDDRGVTRLLYECMEVNYRALNGSAQYRRDHQSLYGLENEELESGILAEGYAGLPEPWTSTYFITNNAKRLVDLCCSWLDQYYPNKVTSAAAPDPGLIESIREMLPGLTDRYLLALQEHYRWTLTRDAESERRYGDLCAKTYTEDRYSKVYRLKNYGLWEAAIEVAKKHNSITALAEIMVEEVRKLRSDALTVDAGTGRAAEKRASALVKEQRIAEYFETYGQSFAFAVYDILLRDDGIKAVLDFPGDKLGYSTKFLRSKPELARISWINDVEREKDVENAADTLLALGLGHEQQLWNKKIELSLGKLALLVEPAAPVQQDSSAEPVGIAKVDQQLAIIRIQDLVYSWVQPSIVAAVDESAELQLAMENHAGRIQRRQKALLQVLEEGLARLLRHEALDAPSLIDVLTLIDTRQNHMAVDQDVFFLALQVADGGLARGEERWQAQRLIWRRCFLRDDWTKINNTQLQDDESTAAVLGLTAAYRTAYSLSINKLSSSATYPVIKPSEALGVYTDSDEAATAARFANMENTFRERLLDAMRYEDSLLRRYIDKSRLEEWCRAAVEGAEKACQTEVERLAAGQDGAVVRPNGRAHFGRA